jgi:hypothetical protein
VAERGFFESHQAPFVQPPFNTCYVGQTVTTRFSGREGVTSNADVLLTTKFDAVLQWTLEAAQVQSGTLQMLDFPPGEEGLRCSQATVRVAGLVPTQQYVIDFDWFVSGAYQQAPVVNAIVQTTPAYPRLYFRANAVLPGSVVTFRWTASDEVEASLGYRLTVGTAKGGTNLYDSGHITRVETTVSGLPTDGSTIYARLHYKVIGSTWRYVDRALKASGP